MIAETPTSLDQLAPGIVAVVAEINTDRIDAARIKRMGICEGRRIQVVRSGDPLIIRVVGTRLGLSARLAPCIVVRPCQPQSDFCEPMAKTDT